MQVTVYFYCVTILKPHFPDTKSWPGWVPRFQMSGIIEGFFFLHRFTIFNCGIFGVRRFGKYFLGWLNLSRDLLRHSKQSKDS